LEKYFVSTKGFVPDLLIKTILTNEKAEILKSTLNQIANQKKMNLFRNGVVLRALIHTMSAVSFTARID
jgi:hypothetical protein